MRNVQRVSAGCSLRATHCLFCNLLFISYVSERLLEEVFVLAVAFPVSLLLAAAVAVWTFADEERPRVSSIKKA